MMRTGRPAIRRCPVRARNPTRRVPRVPLSAASQGAVITVIAAHPRRSRPTGSGRRPRRGARGSGPAGGQATIEFALTFGLLVFSLLACVGAAVWSIETEGAVTAAELAARMSISAQGVGANANRVNVGSATAPGSPPMRLLQSTMFGVQTKSRDGGPGAPCDFTPVAQGTQPGVTLCVEPRGGPADPATYRVLVRVSGCARTLVPLPVGGCQGGAVIDQIAAIHPLVYQQ